MKNLSLPIFLALLTGLSACKKLDLSQMRSENAQINYWDQQLVIDTNAVLITAENQKSLSLKSKAMTNKEDARTEDITPGAQFPIRVEYDLSNKDLTIVKIETNSLITLELPAFAFDLMKPLKEHTMRNLDFKLNSISFGERTYYPGNQNVLSTSYPLLFIPSAQSGQDYDIVIALTENLNYFHLSDSKKSNFKSTNPKSVCDEENSEYYFLNDGYSLKIDQQVLINFYEVGQSEPVASILPNNFIKSIPSGLKKHTCNRAKERSDNDIEV